MTEGVEFEPVPSVILTLIILYIIISLFRLGGGLVTVFFPP